MTTTHPAVEWLRNNYQDYPNVASLCDAMAAALAAASASEPLTEAQIEGCIDDANRRFNGSRQGPSGQQITHYDDWKHWLARGIERAHGIATPPTAPQASEPALLIDERAEFEAWANSNDYECHRDKTAKYKEYHRATTRFSREGWLAAMAWAKNTGLLAAPPASVPAYERDAARYWWLRGNGWIEPALYATGPKHWGANGIALLCGNQLDTAIDAAMSAHQTGDTHE